jgi:hypothetical protein
MPLEPAPPPPPVQPPVPQTPAPPPAPTEPPQDSALMQFFESNGTIKIRLDNSLRPRGFGLITAHGHKHVEPYNDSHEDWMNSNNSRPPEQVINGMAEWDLKISRQVLLQRIRGHNRPSRDVIMVFHKASPDISFWVNVNRDYGINGSKEAPRNITNKGWEVEI